jgi:hypothetical protein
MSRPLLISDCDEVLLHMIVPFRDWLSEAHHIDFDLVHGDWGEALRHKHDGTVVERGQVWDLLNGFFDTEMGRQQAIDGAVDAINRLREHADVVILTNLLDHRAAPRMAQLQAVGIDAPVYTNQGGKGEALGRILEEYRPSVAVFVDDLGHQHDSVGEHHPHVWRLHFVGEPLLWERVSSSKGAHARLDRWADAEVWIRERLVGGVAAPLLERAIATAP